MKPQIIVRFLKRTAAREYSSLYRSIGVENEPGVLYGERKKFTARWAEKVRTIGYSEIPGLGRLRRTESAGPDKRRLRLALDRNAIVVPATAEGVKTAVRRLRPEDQAELTRRNEEIDQVSTALRNLKTARLDFLHESFQRGHVVPLKEVTEMAETKTQEK